MPTPLHGVSCCSAAGAEDRIHGHAAGLARWVVARHWAYATGPGLTTRASRGSGCETVVKTSPQWSVLIHSRELNVGNGAGGEPRCRAEPSRLHRALGPWDRRALGRMPRWSQSVGPDRRGPPRDDPAGVWSSPAPDLQARFDTVTHAVPVKSRRIGRNGSHLIGRGNERGNDRDQLNADTPAWTGARWHRAMRILRGQGTGRHDVISGDTTVMNLGVVGPRADAPRHDRRSRWPAA